MDMYIEKDEILNAFQKVLPYLPYMFEDDISVALTDKEVFLQNFTCPSIPLKGESGDPIQEGGAAKKAMQSGEILIKEIPKEVYGVPFKSYAIPIKDDNGEVVGSVLIAKNLERSKRVIKIANDLATVFSQINHAVNELSQDIQKLAEMNQEIGEQTVQAVEYAKDTNEVLTFVKKIATQTNLLGLNAAIEAARAGAAGRGFEIVANEIRKMSTNTAQSTDKISKVLNSIEASIHDISEKIKESNAIFQEQIAAVEEITASITESYTTVKIIEELSEKI